jgi:endonuclease III
VSGYNNPMTKLSLPQVIDRLQARFGKQESPKLNGPWEMILWENVAYLADDDRREQAFQILKKRIGTSPAKILAASDEALLDVTRHGIMAEQFAGKLRKCAEIVLEEFDGDLRPILTLPLAKAKKALQKFPGIGEPGAEKILLFTRAHPILALESNGLRALVRLGFTEEQKNYAAMYRQAQKSAVAGLDQDCDWLTSAHLLLKCHGQDLCRRTEPLCDECLLAQTCEYRRREGR